MGLCSSLDNQFGTPNPTALTQEEKETLKQEKLRNEEITKNMQADNVVDKRYRKLLLLGPGESGKSTLFKQCLTIYGKGFSEAERVAYTSIVRSNVVECIKVLCNTASTYGGIVGEAPRESKKIMDDLKDDDLNPITLIPAHAHHITLIWKDPGIQLTYEHRNEFQLPDSCKYLMEKVDEICSPTYVPDFRDMLSARSRTTGIFSTEFKISGTSFLMFDVGGQRNERKKWIHCFENVNAVLFVAAISEYDQKLFEDESVNRITESLQLFEEICNSRWFKKTSMVLFLNKCDLFAEKIAKKPISMIYHDYKGALTYEAQAKFIRQLFLRRNRVKNKGEINAKEIYAHLTCALDTSQIQKIFDAVSDTIIRGNLADSGFY